MSPFGPQLPHKNGCSTCIKQATSRPNLVSLPNTSFDHGKAFVCVSKFALVYIIYHFAICCDYSLIPRFSFPHMRALEWGSAVIRPYIHILHMHSDGAHIWKGVLVCTYLYGQYFLVHIVTALVTITHAKSKSIIWGPLVVHNKVTTTSLAVRKWFFV